MLVASPQRSRWFPRIHKSPGTVIGTTGRGGTASHATMLRLLGIDHTRLTIKFQGRDFRLTDVSGRIIEKVLS
jgi:hypothetical protein